MAGGANMSDGYPKLNNLILFLLLIILIGDCLCVDDYCKKC